MKKKEPIETMLSVTSNSTHKIKYEAQSRMKFRIGNKKRDTEENNTKNDAFNFACIDEKKNCKEKKRNEKKDTNRVTLDCNV